jgi:hypothetical protein
MIFFRKKSIGNARLDTGRNASELRVRSTVPPRVTDLRVTRVERGFRIRISNSRFDRQSEHFFWSFRQAQNLTRLE